MVFSKHARSIAAGAIFSLACTSPALAQEGERGSSFVLIDAETSPVAISLASQIVDRGYPEERREALFFATMDQTVEQMRIAIRPNLPQDDPGAIAILDEWIIEYIGESKQVLRKHIPSIMAGMTQAYANLFTVDELTDILAFVDTRSGQKFFELSPAILGEPSFAQANQRYMDESMAMLGPAQEVLMGRLQEYLVDKANEEPADQT
ncbi:MAG: DUF2059 domain-containing protein [Pseudomonadota bacterium]